MNVNINLLLVIYICFYLVFKIFNNKYKYKQQIINEDINIKISPLSYIRTNNNINQMELLNYFLDTEQQIVKNYIKNLNFETKNKPVYAVKKYGNRYEFEIYFYRYNPDRESPIRIILDNVNKFPSIHELNNINKNITKCKLFNTDFIICSYDINYNTVKNGTQECNFYYGVEGGNTVTKYPYYILEEDINGNVIKTNEYGLIKDIMSKNKQKKYLVNKFIDDNNEIVFFAKKPLKNTECIYIEGMTFKKFIKFLKFFNYNKKFINFCKKNYNNSYKFCVSYDLNSSKEIIKTTIFGIFV